MKRFSSALAAVALSVALADATLGCDRGDKPQQLNKPAPMFALQDEQHSVDLNKLRGQVVLLNFWASWCLPCLEELPSLEELHHDNPSLQLVGISIDSDKAAYNRFLTAHQIDFLTVIDPDQRTNALYGSYRPPESYLIDKHGMIRRKFIGPQSWSGPEITSYIEKLQQEP